MTPLRWVLAGLDVAFIVLLVAIGVSWVRTR